MLVSPDGVPIAVPGSDKHSPTDDAEALDHGALGREDALAAIAAGWVNELEQAVAPLSWNPPGRIVLKAARGTLVMQQMRGATLLVILARGLDPEQVRLSMDGAVARIERSVRNMGSAGAPSAADNHFPSQSPEPPGPMPHGQGIRIDVAEVNEYVDPRDQATE